MNETPLAVRQSYLLKHTTQLVQARVRDVRHRVDIHTLEREPADALELNDIGLVEIETHRPLFFDAYSRNRATGSFILIDPLTNETVGAGMIVSAVSELSGQGRVTPAERRARLGHPSAVVVIEDDELAYATERYLFNRGFLVHVLRGEASSEGISEMLAAGFVLVLKHYDGSGPREIPVIEPRKDTSPEQVWVALMSPDAGKDRTNLWGEGI
jgi:hypothetical protein